MNTTAVAAPKVASGSMRSPNFPVISLPEAIKKAKVLYDADGRTAVSPKVLLGHLGYGEKLSGAAGRIIAALRQYGLVEDVAGDKYRVSDAAFHIFTLSEAAPLRVQAIAASAKKPPVFREVLAAYPDRLPSDSALRDFLIAEKKFNPVSVETFIRALKGTVDFAKPHDHTKQDDGEAAAAVFIGDYVQWESQGMLQFQAAKKVVGFSDDGAYAFVEGETTGIPMEQLSKVDPPGLPPRVPPLMPSHLAGAANGGGKLPPNVAREVFSLEDGEAVLQWPTTLNADGVQELEDWLALVVKKLKRLKAKQV